MRLRLQEEANPYERIGRGFREQVGEDRGAGVLVFAVLGAALFGLLLWALARRDRGEGRRLFRRLSDANGLSREERRFLTAVAERAGEPNAASLFFRRGAFEEAVADMSPNPAVLDGVRRKVYGP